MGKQGAAGGVGDNVRPGSLASVAVPHGTNLPSRPTAGLWRFELLGRGAPSTVALETICCALHSSTGQRGEGAAMSKSEYTASFCRVLGAVLCGASLTFGKPGWAAGFGVLAICQAVDIVADRIIAALTAPPPSEKEGKEPK